MHAHSRQNDALLCAAPFSSRLSIFFDGSGVCEESRWSGVQWSHSGIALDFISVKVVHAFSKRQTHLSFMTNDNSYDKRRTLVRCSFATKRRTLVRCSCQLTNSMGEHAWRGLNRDGVVSESLMQESPWISFLSKWFMHCRNDGHTYHS